MGKIVASWYVDLVALLPIPAQSKCILINDG